MNLAGEARQQGRFAATGGAEHGQWPANKTGCVDACASNFRLGLPVCTMPLILPSGSRKLHKQSFAASAAAGAPIVQAGSVGQRRSEILQVVRSSPRGNMSTTSSTCSQPAKSRLRSPAKATRCLDMPCGFPLPACARLLTQDGASKAW